jgi:hypothetical protein
MSIISLTGETEQFFFMLHSRFIADNDSEWRTLLELNICR